MLAMLGRILNNRHPVLDEPFECRPRGGIYLTRKASTRFNVHSNHIMPSPSASVTSTVFLLLGLAAQNAPIQWVAQTHRQGTPLRLGRHLGIGCDGYVSREHFRRWSSSANILAVLRDVAQVHLPIRVVRNVDAPGSWEMSLVV
jgi:hypothetical protein